MVAVFFKEKLDDQNEVKFYGANRAFFEGDFLILTNGNADDIVPTKVGQFFAENILGFYVEED